MNAPKEQAKFWHDRTLNNLELLRATYITHVFAPHAHEGYAIGIIEAGAQTFTHKGRNRLIMPAGCIAIVNPGEVHIGQATTESGWTYRMFYPDAAVLESVAAELFGRVVDTPFFSSPVVYDRVLFQAIYVMHRALEDPYTSQLGREVLLLQAVAQLIIRYADFRPSLNWRGSENRLMGKVRTYLNENYAADLSLNDLAAYAELDRAYLIRAFKRVYGLPPHAYQLQIRVERAKAFLLSGLPIADVAAITGFVDQSHLTRHFKRIVGIPPGQYRRVV
jgi:AraC-like DNA-binding protein